MSEDIIHAVVSHGYGITVDVAPEHEMEKILSGIPEDASVLCSTFLLPHVAQRAEVYELGSGREAEFVILDLRMEGEDEAIYARLIGDPPYTLWDFSQSLIAVFRRNGDGVLSST